MAIEGELTRAGIIALDDQTVFTKDVLFGADVTIAGGLNVAEDSLFARNINVAGYIIGTLAVGYVLDAVIADLSAAVGCYMVVPSDGAGYIARVRTVLLNNLTVSAATLSININGGTDLDDAYDIVIGVGSAGDIDSSISIPSSADNNGVAVGNYIHIYPSTLGGSVASCRVQVELIGSAS